MSYKKRVFLINKVAHYPNDCKITKGTLAVERKNTLRLNTCDPKGFQSNVGCLIYHAPVELDLHSFLS